MILHHSFYTVNKYFRLIVNNFDIYKMCLDGPWLTNKWPMNMLSVVTNDNILVSFRI